MDPEARKATEMRKNIIIRKQKRDEDQMTRVCLLSLQTRYKMVSSETTSTEITKASSPRFNSETLYYRFKYTQSSLIF